MNNIFELFSKYSIGKNDHEVEKTVEALLKASFERNNTKAVYCKLLENIDLTTLKSTDNSDSVLKLVDKINQFDSKFDILPLPAGICVYPAFVPTVKESLTEDVDIVAVAGGFPHSQTFIEVKMAEVGLAIASGASEIDIVFPVGKFFAGEYDEIYDEISEIKACCKDVTLKVILEVSLLKTVENIEKAAIMAINAGADFIKTSTGKDGSVANLTAAYVMCEVIRKMESEIDRQVGFKAAGGISNSSDAVKYYSIVESVLGVEHTDKSLFRIGASSLANNLLSDIAGEEVKYF
ncbi:MAG: deoxyribose-phosphate aldolase [Paludibacteraceae bacterium]|nr:deoxyribose-phosphate aldolase [Paludibacteraceae bacterium]